MLSLVALAAPFLSLVSAAAGDVARAQVVNDSIRALDSIVTWPQAPVDTGYDRPPVSMEEACRSGCKTYYDGCNTCMCNPDGSAACTKMFCIMLFDPSNPPRCLDEELADASDPATETSDPVSESTAEDTPLSIVEEACKSGCHTYFDGCNTCICSPDGPICTEMFCIALYDPENPPRCLSTEPPAADGTDPNTPVSDNTKVTDVSEEETSFMDAAEACESGCTNYYDGCNTCVCSPDGPICTLRYCEKINPDDPPRCLDDENNKSELEEATPDHPSFLTLDEACESGCTNYYDGCNTCVCGPDGPICTLRFCITLFNPDDPPRCLDNELSEAGEVESSEVEQVIGEPQVTEPSIVNSESITERAYSYRSVSEACMDGCASFYDGCNTCTCGENGVAACTQMFCITLYDPNNRPYCKAYKSEEGDAEIIINLPAEEPETESQDEESLEAATETFEHLYDTAEAACLDGCEAYFDGCNHCGCQPDGTAFCTMMWCEPNPLNPPRCLKFFDETDELEEDFTDVPSVSDYDSERFTPTGEECVEGCTVWNNGCQNCHCVDGQLHCDSYTQCIWMGEPFCAVPEEESPSPSTTDEVEEVSDMTADEEVVCPRGCGAWHDGCNTCICKAPGELGGCTRRFCLRKDKPRCLSMDSDEAQSAQQAQTTTAVRRGLTSASGLRGKN